MLGYHQLIAGPARRRAGLSDAALAAAEVELTEAGASWVAAVFPALRAEAALERGDLDAARDHASHAREIVDASPFMRFASPMVLRTQARIALARGDVGPAEDLAHRALSEFVESGMRWGVPEVLETIAAVAVELEANAYAARLLSAAAAIRVDLRWMPGVPDVREIDALTERLHGFEDAFEEGRAMTRDEALAYASRGGGERKRPARGWDSLAPTERDVVRLATEGLRTAEIAAKLFVSPTTVKTHLAHVYAKLVVRTRAELVALASRHTAR